MSHVMSHKLEDLQAKTNKLTEEAGNENWTSSERREDTGHEDIKPTPTTTTTSSNHHQRQKLKGSSLFHLPPRQHRFNYRRHRHRRGRQNQPRSEKQDKLSLI
ncbi:unnamed protein product [Heterobilharzia americana]|nr:unnamed protein product [Heterobilharzia americana]